VSSHDEWSSNVSAKPNLLAGKGFNHPKSLGFQNGK